MITVMYGRSLRPPHQVMKGPRPGAVRPAPHWYAVADAVVTVPGVAVSQISYGLSIAVAHA